MKTLFVIKNMRLSNGVASYAMNYYRQLSGTDVYFDFLVISDVGSPYYSEIESNGSKVFLLPSYKKEPMKIIPYLDKMFHDNHYDIVHCNVMNSGSLVLMMAKKYGVSVRILHSHSARTGDRKWKEIRNKLFCGLSLKFANTYFSCSHLAGDYLFGKDNYYIIPNAINIDRFSFDNKKRLSCRKEENCEEKFIITTVGRFARPKNTMFIVDIIYEMSKFDKDFVFWWFGNGELEQVVKAYAKEKDVEKFIKFWGANPNVNVYYSAADVFILPSLYEGLPVVGIEAQVASLPALFSDRITREVKISDSVEFLPITDAGLWAKSILKYRGFDREKNANGLDLTEYKIEEQAKRLKQLYIKLLKGK